ncbi:hypothetical protein HanPI659440_Chr13g0484641 [Helianthus annuus]|nr:hypothetical protein HanPI659440_Chr13g0484641 [Helianthus annuus]
MAKGEELTVNVPGLVKTLTDEGPCVFLHTPAVQNGDIQTVGFATAVADDNLLIHVKTDEEIYLGGMKLPENFDKNGCYKAVFAGEMLKNTNIMPDFVDTAVKITRPTPYCVMFDRLDLGRRLCGLIGHPRVKSKSFTLYKKDTCESIYMKRNLPGVERPVITRDGACVFLNMPGLELEDVYSGFEYDALVIEGRRENEHYIAGIRVPEGFHREHHMIKREMRDGVFKATLPHVDVKRRVFSLYR